MNWENFYKDQYTQLHNLDEAMFNGRQTLFVVDYVKKIFTFFKVRTLLDYGCGKGYQYFLENINKKWNVDKVYLYDIGVKEFSIKPSKDKKFDCVICLDVLEHIRETDIDNVLTDLFDYSENLVLATISTRKAKKTLPNGENAHLTVKDKNWWNEKIVNFYNKNNNKYNKIKCIVLYEEDSNIEKKQVNQFFINFSKEEIESLEKI